MLQPSYKFHRILSEYFSSLPLYLDSPAQKKPNTRKLVEQPWQQTKGEMLEQVDLTLCNLLFIEAKLKAGLFFELQDDYKEAWLQLGKTNVFDNKSFRFPAYSKAYSQEISQLMYFKKNGVDIPFINFILQQFRNRIYCNSSGQIEIIEKSENQTKLALVQKRPIKNSSFIRRIDTDFGINRYLQGTIKFSPNGEMLFVVSMGPKVLCVDSNSGRELYALNCIGRAISFDFSPDSKQLIVGGDRYPSKGGFIQVFDINTKETIQLKELDIPVIRLIITANRNIYVSYQRIVRILDLNSLQLIHEWRPFDNNFVQAIATNKKRTQIAFGEFHDKDSPARISIWDARTVTLLKEIEGPKYGISALAFSNFDGIIASGSIHLNNGVVAWQWQLPGTEIDKMLLSAQHRQKALDLLKISGREKQVSEGQVISILYTSDSVYSLVFFPNQSWIVALESSFKKKSDTINIFDIFDTGYRNVSKILGHSSLAISVDIDFQGSLMATLHLNGEIMIWPADDLKKLNPEAPPKSLMNHYSDLSCRYVLSVDNDPHQYVHITDIETGTDIISNLSIPSHKAALVPTGEYFVRFYWSELPLNPYPDNDGDNSLSKKWGQTFLSNTPVCCTVHSITNILDAHKHGNGLPKDYKLIENITLDNEIINKWIFPPMTEASNICFSRNGEWGAAIIGSQTLPVHIFCFAPKRRECKRFSLPVGFISGYLIFENNDSLCLIGIVNDEKSVAYFDINSMKNETHTKIYNGFGKTDQITFGPLPIGKGQFVSVIGNKEIILYESQPDHLNPTTKGTFQVVAKIKSHFHNSSINSLSYCLKSKLIVVLDSHPSICIYKLPSFQLIYWRPMDQELTDAFWDANETQLLVIGKFTNLDGLNYSLMTFCNVSL